MLTRSIKALFGTKKRTQVQNTAPEVYYRHVYLSKANYEGVEFMAKTTHTSRTHMANELIQRGIRSFYGEAVGEAMTDNNEQRSHSKRISTFIWHLQRYAKSQGYNITDFIK